MMEKLAEVTLDSDQTSVTFENIPDEYEHLVLYIEGMEAGTSDSTHVIPVFNGDTDSENYESYDLSWSDSVDSTIRSNGRMNWAQTDDRDNNASLVQIEGYSNTSIKTTYTSTTAIPAFGNGRKVNGWWDNTDIIYNITLESTDGKSYKDGSYFALYGVKA